MTKNDYIEEAQKIDWEGGLSDYIIGYGGSSIDPDLQAIYAEVTPVINAALKRVEDYFASKGVPLDNIPEEEGESEDGEESQE